MSEVLETPIVEETAAPKFPIPFEELKKMALEVATTISRVAAADTAFAQSDVDAIRVALGMDAANMLAKGQHIALGIFNPSGLMDLSKGVDSRPFDVVKAFSRVVEFVQKQDDEDTEKVIATAFGFVANLLSAACGVKTFNDAMQLAAVRRKADTNEERMPIVVFSFIKKGTDIVTSGLKKKATNSVDLSCAGRSSTFTLMWDVLGLSNPFPVK